MKRILLFLVAMAASAAVPIPLGFWKTGPSGPSFPNDSFESYTNNVTVNALDGGSHWNGAYVDRFAPTGIYDLDYLESYSDAAAVNGLNGADLGFNNGAYVDRDGLFGIKANDDLESYSDGVSVNALNGGSDWGGAFVVLSTHSSRTIIRGNTDGRGGGAWVLRSRARHVAFAATDAFLS